MEMSTVLYFGPKTASIVNKDYVSQYVSDKLDLCINSTKELLRVFAMDWTEGTMGDQPVGPIFHVPVSSSKSCLLSTTPASKNQTTNVSTITDPIPPPPHLPFPHPLPTSPPHFPAPLFKIPPFPANPPKKN